MLEAYGAGNLVEERISRPCDLDSALEAIEDVQSHFPELPLFEVLRRFFLQPKEVCPVPFVDPWTNWLINMESSCERYGHLPYDGGWLDQPEWVIDVFTEIHTIRNEFEKQRMRQITKDSDK